ncbi:MAG: protein kinase [Clostridiales bacterium]|nr:protein kinase [Clostridiales bacterium]
MKYHGIYEVDPAFVDGGSIKWKLTGNGEFVIATRGGKTYFVKRNLHARYPTRDLSPKLYEVRKAEANALQKKQARLRTLMKGLTLSDHIVGEDDNFWDSEQKFTTITAHISEVLPDDFDYTKLSLDEFVKLAILTMEALGKLHAHKVIHGDLKGKNILVRREKGVYTPYIIDFDSSYPVDEIPDWESIGGSEGYQSPEVILYASDEDAAPKDTITAATDIFSMGVILHKWWVGAFPSIDLERGTVGHAVYLDKAVTIDKKFNVKIGKNCGATLQSLINWMLAKEPANRPTARQVQDVLSDKLEVPEAYHKGSDDKPFDTELWDSHKAVAELLPKDELQKSLKSLKRINESTGSAGLKYRIVTTGGKERVLTISELCEAGYAKSKGAMLEEPWPEHGIEFVSPDEIAKKGYGKISRAVLAYRKRYFITTTSGRQFDKGYEWLISEGLARLKLSEVDADTPWPEHGTSYSIENMSRMGVKSISRVEVGGEHRYRVVYNQIIDGKNKTNENVPANNLKLMGFIK